MANYVAVGVEKFANFYWRTASHFRQFSAMPVCHLGANEATQAALHLPLAFIKHDNTFDLVALVGLRPDDSLGVDPITGRWVLNYLPQLYRTYPFRITNDQDRIIVVVDQTSGLISNDPDQGHPFFTTSGQPSESFQQVINVLQELHQGRMGAFMLCKQLEDAGILEPWPLKVQLDENDTTPAQIDGLYRINESALTALGNVPFLSLRQNGALALAYSQLLSMGNIHKLARLAYQRYQVADFEPDKNIGFDSDTISFS